jgi:hypothetical protein
MKLLPFDHSKMEWDAWRAFHIDYGYNKFTQFDTGEFVVHGHRWGPEARQVYKDFHIQIVATGDEDCPKLYLPGMASVVGAKPVFKSHLNHNGMQTLLLDFDHKRAVSIECRLTRDHEVPVPERFTDRHSRVVAYYAGPGSMPVTGGPITRHYPQPLKPEERTHINELVEASKVWLQMQPNPDELKKKHRNVTKLLVGEFVDVSFGALTPEHRAAIAIHEGFNMIVKETHPWLTFNTEKEWTNDEETDD